MDLVTSGASLGKGRLAEVALFDGINGPDELAAAQQWVVKQLDRASGQLQAPAVKGKPAKEDLILAGVVRFRAYHSGPATAKPSQKTGTGRACTPRCGRRSTRGSPTTAPS